MDLNKVSYSTRVDTKCGYICLRNAKFWIPRRLSALIANQHMKGNLLRLKPYRMQINKEKYINTKSPAVAEGPRDVGVPVEMSTSMSIVDL